NDVRRVIYLPSRRAPAPVGRLPPGVRAPPLSERRVVDHLRLRERAAALAPGAVGVAQGRQGDAAQPAAAAVPGGLPPDAPRAADRPGPGADPARHRRAATGGAEALAAAPGRPAGPQAGAGGGAGMIATLLRGLRALLTVLVILPVRFYQICLRPLLPSV